MAMTLPVDSVLVPQRRRLCACAAQRRMSPRRNLITDVAGVRVGNAEDAKLASGVTAIVFDEPAVAAVDVRGGAPGTRETDLLDAHRTVERIDAVVLSRRLGLRARCRLRRAGLAARARPRLCHRRRPHSDRAAARCCSTCATAATRAGGATRPIAISATLRQPPPAPTSRSAPPAPASAPPPSICKGGLGSASAATREGHHRRRAGRRQRLRQRQSSAATAQFWAAPFEQDGEFGGLGLPGDGAADSAGRRAPRADRARTPPSPSSRPTPH